MLETLGCLHFNFKKHSIKNWFLWSFFLQFCEYLFHNCRLKNSVMKLFHLIVYAYYTKQHYLCFCSSSSSPKQASDWFIDLSQFRLLSVFLELSNDIRCSFAWGSTPSSGGFSNCTPPSGESSNFLFGVMVEALVVTTDTLTVFALN